MQSRVCQFMDLPPELRLMVWKFALRPLGPDRPGAHFFSVTNIKKDGNEAARISTRCGMKDCGGYHLAAPRVDSSEGSHSWTVKNPSAYVWDFGMWSACRESRHVIEAHYKTVCWSVRTRRGYTISRSYGQTSVPLVLPGNNSNWHLLFHPKQDLVCLQALDPSAIHRSPNLAGWRNDFCFASNCPSLFELGHVAIAYDPSWNDIKDKMDKFSFRRLYKEPSARGFFIRTLATLDHTARCRWHYPRDRPSIWLIDYNLKRCRYLKKQSKGRKAFYSNDQKFIEVDRTASRRSYSAGEHSSALEFLDSLDICLFVLLLTSTK
ncbi:hypothetical protein V8C42DRAFT_167084 [Trichoderma barbatum]